MASIVNVSIAPANRSLALFTPLITGTAMYFSAKSAYTLSIFTASSIASSYVACAVCPSCHRNSAVRRNILVLISQRITLAHWLTRIGRSRYEWIQFLYVFHIMVSDVGRMISSSSSFASGSTMTPLPAGSFFNLWWVTTAHSLAKPSTCSASRLKNDFGINSGKYAFWWPVSLNILSSCCCIFSQIAYP